MKKTNAATNRSRRRESANNSSDYVTPRIHFRMMNRCQRCGSDNHGYEFIIQDQEPGGRTARPEELMQYGFLVPPGSVDMVATLIAQQIAKWNGLTRSIPGSDDPAELRRNPQESAANRKPCSPSVHHDRNMGPSRAASVTQVSSRAKKARRPKS